MVLLSLSLRKPFHLFRAAQITGWGRVPCKLQQWSPHAAGTTAAQAMGLWVLPHYTEHVGCLFQQESGCFQPHCSKHSGMSPLYQAPGCFPMALAHVGTSTPLPPFLFQCTTHTGAGALALLSALLYCTESALHGTAGCHAALPQPVGQEAEAKGRGSSERPAAAAGGSVMGEAVARWETRGQKTSA